MLKIEIDGDEIDNVEAFIRECCQHLSCDNNRVPDLSSLNSIIEEYDDLIKIIWYNSERSKTRLVRNSDVPLDKLPDGGSNMMREIVLALVYEKISLFEKVSRALSQSPRVKISDR